jgi:hypothetical protein
LGGSSTTGPKGPRKEAAAFLSLPDPMVLKQAFVQAWQPLSEPIARNNAHFGCGAGAPPEVPGGGTTFGSRALGAPFSIPGSTSFGWMTPFDWFSFSLRLRAGAVESRGGVGVGRGLGAWANAEPATRVAPATNSKVVSR